MNYSDHEKAFSPARLNKYLTACGGNTMSALTLYRHNKADNLDVAQKLTDKYDYFD